MPEDNIPFVREIVESEFLTGENDHEEAKDRYKKWKSQDPFPGVKPALLHSGQIRDYILKTGMLSPFTREDLENIKPASIEIPFEGRVVYWDEKDEKVDKWISAKNGKSPAGQFTLKSNSIAFVQVKPRFQLPDYIAIRFNLKITHVYRGLLLGTGPLVDPGYQGHLYIPLHNLTSNDYEFLGGEGLLWMEFTKLQWDHDERPCSSGNKAVNELEYPEGFKRFPLYKTDMHLEDFFRKANDNRAISSSIPKGIESARISSESAKNSVALIRNVGLAALIALGLGLLSMFLTTWNLGYEVKHKMGDTVQQLEADRDRMQTQIKSLSQQFDALKQQSASADESNESE